jgi:hypothetical protein
MMMIFGAVDAKNMKLLNFFLMYTENRRITRVDEFQC